MREYTEKLLEKLRESTAAVFSLPVTDIAGMYLMNEMLEEA